MPILKELDKGVRKKIEKVIKKSGFECAPSKSATETLVIKGDLIQPLISEPEILNLVDKGVLNLWSGKKKSQTFSFVQANSDKKPRFRNFGLFHHNRRLSLQELREKAGESGKIDHSTPGLYPWEFKYYFKASNYEDYYFTKDWTELKAKFYEAKYDEVYECSCCGENLAIEKQLLNLHHIIPIRNGGSNDSLNLILLCIACHSLVHKSGWLLVEPLFIHYAQSGDIGSKRIRRTLVNKDDMVSTNSIKSFLHMYDSFARRINYAEAKLFFFHEIETAFRYFKRLRLSENIDLFLRCNEYKHHGFDMSWNDMQGVLNSNESLYDLYVHSMRIYSLIERIVYYKKDESSANRKKATKLEWEVDLCLGDLISFLRLAEVSEETLAQLLIYAHHDGVQLRDRMFFKKQTYIRPSRPLQRNEKDDKGYRTRLDYYRKAVVRRNCMVETLARAMSPDLPGSILRDLETELSNSLSDSLSEFHKRIGELIPREQRVWDGKKIKLAYDQILDHCSSNNISG